MERVAVIALLLLAAASRARALEPAAAERLFNEARAAMDAGNFSVACEKLAESQRLDPQLGTLLHLAHCNEKSGNLASAQRLFSEAAEVAAAKAARGEREPREDVARKRAAGLERRVSRVFLSLAEPDAVGLSVVHDGAPWPRASWGTGLAIDPGVHRVEVSATDKQRWQYEYQVTAERQRLRVRVPMLTAAAVAQAAPVASPAPEVPAQHVATLEVAAASAPATQSGDPDAVRGSDSIAAPAADVTPTTPSDAAGESGAGSSGTLQRVFGYVALGLGATAGAFAAASFVSTDDVYAETKQRRADFIKAGCVSGCDASRKSELTAKFNAAQSTTNRRAMRSYILLGAAGAAVIGGLTLLLTVPEQERAPTPDSKSARRKDERIQLGLMLAPGSASVSVDFQWF